jgi:hypothetical protein
MAEPLIVYLDTQDYSNFYNIKDDNIRAVYDYLCNKVDKGEVIIPYSYFIIAEFITDFTEKFKEDRLKRIAIINRLCKKNTFKFLDINSLFDYPLSKDGHWYPKVDIWENIKIGIKEQEAELLKMLPKNISSELSHKNLWPQLFKLLPQLKVDILKAAKNLPVPKSFHESQLLIKYLNGEINDDIIREESEKILSDLNIFFTFWFENKSNNNVKFLHESIRLAGNSFIELAKSIIILCNNSKEYLDFINSFHLNKELKQDIYESKNILRKFQNLDLEFVKSFIPDILLSSKLPIHFIDTILLYAIGNMKANRKVQESDTGDLMHAFYLPYCDLWRGDIRFSNLLIDQKVDGHQKIVKHLTQLPNFIENRLTEIR